MTEDDLKESAEYRLNAAPNNPVIRDQIEKANQQTLEAIQLADAPKKEAKQSDGHQEWMEQMEKSSKESIAAKAPKMA